jgi:predicted site-specific integrase-resolvase
VCAATRRHTVTSVSDLLTTADAAKALGVSPRTLQRWARDGLVHPELRLPHGQLRWNLAELRKQLSALPDPQD